jgi:DNA-binding NtrC family response regulator
MHMTVAPDPLLRKQRDGAAPLIGTTPPVQALRSTIERVAGTDFTVLLEGPGPLQESTTAVHG